MPLQALITKYQKRVDSVLENCLPNSSIQPNYLHEAMRYATMGGGKRIRPILTYLTGEALNIDLALLDAPACAVELIHAYSLVHDDLPAMDNDDLRRGKPTCHKAYDEATAILVGDALQTLAFYLLSHDSQLNKIATNKRLKMVEILALATGSRGMAGGQAIDMESIGKSLNIAELENMHVHKTGALIRTSINLAMLASETITEAQQQKLDHYAKCIGLAFQIQDDILDVESNTEVLGKQQGSDIAHNKVTYPALLGLSGAKQMALELVNDAKSSLNIFDNKAEPLSLLANYIITRHF
ncbi:MAG: (2E,6E)-farnesyl diphosphate synthase [Thiomargarita sp.]|nr:(2E,6E)-farnesyl diphosphate synthase [Thiomargarita sp.]